MTSIAPTTATSSSITSTVLVLHRPRGAAGVTLEHLDERARRAVAEVRARRAVTCSPVGEQHLSACLTWCNACQVENVTPVSCLKTRCKWRVLSPSRRAHSSTLVASPDRRRTRSRSGAAARSRDAAATRSMRYPTTTASSGAARRSARRCSRSRRRSVGVVEVGVVTAGFADQLVQQLDSRGSSPTCRSGPGARPGRRTRCAATRCRARTRGAPATAGSRPRSVS